MYAANFGLANKWVKYFQKRGMAVAPPWSNSLTTTNVNAVSHFVMMIAVSHAVSGSSGAGGGAAGGERVGSVRVRMWVVKMWYGHLVILLANCPS